MVYTSTNSKMDNSPLLYRMGIESAAAIVSALSVAPAISIVGIFIHHK
jgi:hypothetical protein